VVVAALLAGTAEAQQEPVLGGDAPAAATPQSAWASQCVADGRSGNQDCSVFQRVVTQAGQLVGSVTVRIPPGGEPVMVVSTPLGLYLPNGITFSIDGSAPSKLELQTCEQTGCIATLPVSEEALNAMSKGQKIDISFANMNRQTITLPLSLVGFTAAFQRIK
jgi:invasion protein IalB